MLAFLNILYLLLPISQTGSEAGVNIIAGPNLEFTKLESVQNQTYFYDEEDFQMGFHYGLGGYYNYYFDRDFYLGLKAAYRNQNTTILEYEPEVINIEGQAVDGEFEHYFDYNLETINLALSGGYRLNQRFSIELGLLYALPISDYQIHSKETIVKPVDAGVFLEEGTRIRNEKHFTTPSNSSKIGTTISINAMFPMNKNETLFLKPSLSYSYIFSENLDNLSSWKTDFIDLSLGVSFVLGENDIFVDKNKIIEPVIDIVIFNLDGTAERNIKNLDVGYIEAKGLQGTNDEKMILKSEIALISYVGIKELLNRKATFYIKSNDEELYRIDNLEKSNRFEINLDNIIDKITLQELEFIVNTEDGFDKSQSININFSKVDKINYLLSNTANDIIEYMNNNNTQKFELYTNDKEVYKILSDYNISNLTIKTKGNFPYHFDQLEGMKYLLVVE